MWSNISSSSSGASFKEALSVASECQVNQNRLNGVGKHHGSQPPTSIGPAEEEKTIKRESKTTSGSPLMRYKHAVCSAPTGFIYIHGGRFGNLALDDDVWRFDPHQNSWLQLRTRGSKPPSLQEHSMVEHNEQLYLFGGQVSASSVENSFWRLDLVTNEWHSMNMKSSKYGAYLGPTNRRGHSAVVYADSMYIFGGFEDFRGSSGQLWEFELVQRRWELRNLSSTSACHPEPRHSHSAIVYNDSMYVYGGLSNLKPLGDLWRWSWRDKRWFRERTRGRAPGQLHGHTAVQAFGSMFVFGGERNGRPTRSLWRLNLSNLSWQKVRAKGPRPSPTTWHGAIANPLSILDETNYIIEGDVPDGCLAKQSGPLGASFASYHPQVMAELKETLQKRPLSHSKSSSVDAIGRGDEAGAKSSRRRSRLSFMRRNRTRSQQPYELKPVQVSASASSLRPQPLEPAKVEESETNAKILDNLDTDIKRMFERAMSPDEPDELMAEEPSSARYQTAEQASCEELAAAVRSQRTSYAYQTPPSELVESEGVPARLLAELTAPSGFHRRDNRPKSEIVQSLIERADARIKHLYTPFFGQQPAGKQRGPARQQPAQSSRTLGAGKQPSSSLDKSKRHTIHQTMTYYNLYFSEDQRSSNSDSNGASSAADQQRPTGEMSNRQPLARDQLSSHTIVNYSAALVGVHGDRESQLSFETHNSSESRTLCESLAGQQVVDQQQPQQQQLASSTSSSSGQTAPGSLQNALTSRRDTPGQAESCNDNTSLSFSVIAEFEEDDMLQYSSPVFQSRQARMEAAADEQGGQPAHKSASSGYDSNLSATNSSRVPLPGAASDSSSLEPETSPEQSGARRLQAKKMRQQDKCASSTTADSLALDEASFSHFEPAQVDRARPSSRQAEAEAQGEQAASSLLSTGVGYFRRARRPAGKTGRYWQLCMFVLGGKQGGAGHGLNEPLTIWRLYI